MRSRPNFIALNGFLIRKSVGWGIKMDEFQMTKNTALFQVSCEPDPGVKLAIF